MPRAKKFTAAQIIGKRRDAEVSPARAKIVSEVVRKLHHGDTTVYRGHGTEFHAQIRSIGVVSFKGARSAIRDPDREVASGQMLHQQSL